MLRLIQIVLLIVLLTATSGMAQHYNFKQYSVEEGLPRSGVYCLLQDSRGFLWTGTEGGGLSRFDGKEFVTFTIGNGLPDNTIRSLFEDKAGNLWIGIKPDKAEEKITFSMRLLHVMLMRPSSTVMHEPHRESNFVPWNTITLFTFSKKAFEKVIFEK